MKFSRQFTKESEASEFVKGLKEEVGIEASYKQDGESFVTEASIGETEKKESYSTDEVYDMIEGLYSYVNYEMKYAFNRINYLAQSFYSHAYEGHLPKVNGAEQMQKAVSALGLDGEYEVQKKTIWASKGGNLEVIVDGIKK